MANGFLGETSKAGRLRIVSKEEIKKQAPGKAACLIVFTGSFTALQ